MAHQEWMLEQIERLQKESKDYRQIALFQEFGQLVREQFKRIEQTEGEIDGRIWSRKEWG